MGHILKCVIFIFLAFSIPCNADQTGHKDSDAHFSKAIHYLEEAERFSLNISNTEVGVAVANNIGDFVKSLKADYELHDMQKMQDDIDLFFENLSEILSECANSRSQICDYVDLSIRELYSII